jgi:flagellar biosynthetic protein FliO
MTGGGLADTATFLSYLLSVLVSLGVVILIAWLSLRLAGGRLGALGGRRRAIRVIETAPLGGRRFLHLVEAAGKMLLVGSSDGGISLVAELDPEKIETPPPPPPGGEGGVKKTFSDILRRLRP